MNLTKLRAGLQQQERASTEKTWQQRQWRYGDEGGEKRQCKLNARDRRVQGPTEVREGERPTDYLQRGAQGGEEKGRA